MMHLLRSRGLHVMGVANEIHQLGTYLGTKYLALPRAELSASL